MGGEHRTRGDAVMPDVKKYTKPLLCEQQTRIQVRHVKKTKESTSKQHKTRKRMTWKRTKKTRAKQEWCLPKREVIPLVESRAQSV